MRHPNPPDVVIFHLPIHVQSKLIKLALLVVSDLARDKPWDAYSKMELAHLDVEEEVALWSLFDSTQRTTLKSIGQANAKS